MEKEGELICCYSFWLVDADLNKEQKMLVQQKLSP